MFARRVKSLPQSDDVGKSASGIAPGRSKRRTKCNAGKSGCVGRNACDRSLVGRARFGGQVTRDVETSGTARDRYALSASTQRRGSAKAYRLERGHPLNKTLSARAEHANTQ